MKQTASDGERLKDSSQADTEGEALLTQIQKGVPRVPVIE